MGLAVDIKESNALAAEVAADMTAAGCETAEDCEAKCNLHDCDVECPRQYTSPAGAVAGGFAANMVCNQCLSTCHAENGKCTGLKARCQETSMVCQRRNGIGPYATVSRPTLERALKRAPRRCRTRSAPCTAPADTQHERHVRWRPRGPLTTAPMATTPSRPSASARRPRSCSRNARRFRRATISPFLRTLTAHSSRVMRRRLAMRPRSRRRSTFASARAATTPATASVETIRRRTRSWAITPRCAPSHRWRAPLLGALRLLPTALLPGKAP